MNVILRSSSTYLREMRSEILYLIIVSIQRKFNLIMGSSVVSIIISVRGELIEGTNLRQGFDYQRVPDQVFRCWT